MTDIIFHKMIREGKTKKIEQVKVKQLHILEDVSRFSPNTYQLTIVLEDNSVIDLGILVGEANFVDTRNLSNSLEKSEAKP